MIEILAHKATVSPNFERVQLLDGIELMSEVRNTECTVRHDTWLKTWVDGDQKPWAERYVVFRVNTTMLEEFLRNEITLLQLYEDLMPNEFVFVLDCDSKGNETTKVILAKNIPQCYIPTTESLYLS